MLIYKAADARQQSFDPRSGLDLEAGRDVPQHTHASQLIASGVDMLRINCCLGHGSPSTTLRVYGHLFENTDASHRDHGSNVRRSANRMTTEGAFFASKALANAGREDGKPHKAGLAQR